MKEHFVNERCLIVLDFCQKNSFKFKCLVRIIFLLPTKKVNEQLVMKLKVFGGKTDRTEVLKKDLTKMRKTSDSYFRQIFFFELSGSN